jgi:hypothetical protein
MSDPLCSSTLAALLLYGWCISDAYNVNKRTRYLSGEADFIIVTKSIQSCFPSFSLVCFIKGLVIIKRYLFWIQSVLERYATCYISTFYFPSSNMDNGLICETSLLRFCFRSQIAVSNRNTWNECMFVSNVNMTKAGLCLGYIYMFHYKSRINMIGFWIPGVVFYQSTQSHPLTRCLHT